ncbi:Rv3235 family protein [Pseudonocardia oroxyli]|uniref:Uncharacterized protein n=1 Tax=Pseudonocardia oroxyli TaxID=366584 RepID=A0A1G8CQ38_PSEOR|nr:Rv3235 family protein [Pseudonocardia oroxyli]SDH47319.1 hypothetical protein SAMN05216377_12322 [Pseudonocardia oroxyli]
MTITRDSEETTQDILRTALGLKPRYRYIWDGQELLGPCERCGHHPVVEEPTPLPAGDPVVDIVQDQEALREAAAVVAMLVDVLDQRRSPRQVRDLVNPRVLRYLAALPTDRAGSHGGARLLSVRAVQPHEGAVEVAASVRLRGRRRALAASFELGEQWVCETIRVL